MWRRIHACHVRRRMHACHMRRRIHGCHMRRRICISAVDKKLFSQAGEQQLG
jgi:hypothetical protein